MGYIRKLIRREIDSHTWLTAIAAVVIASLLLAGLRMTIVRLRYAVAEGVTVEQGLLAEKRDMTVDLLRLREPKLLSVQAAALGFSAPERIINFHTPAEAKPPFAAQPDPHVASAPAPVVAGSRP
ncbi:MAG: hypothetical protein H8E63_05235 [Proteobacteria bacterium]|nr:hypothetical protein [Pseudomonadota bacterium]